MIQSLIKAVNVKVIGRFWVNQKIIQTVIKPMFKITADVRHITFEIVIIRHGAKAPLQLFL